VQIEYYYVRWKRRNRGEREREEREDFLEKIFHEQIGRVPYYL